MTVIVIRGANGVVVWERISGGINTHAWVCTRDQYRIAVPDQTAGLEAFLSQLAAHSQSLVGAIAQVVQLTI